MQSPFYSGHVSSWKAEWDSYMVYLSPHFSDKLWNCMDYDLPWIWGTCVENLWRVTMMISRKSSHWNILTQSLLIWRMIVDDGQIIADEWVWREMIQYISIHN